MAISEQQMRAGEAETLALRERGYAVAARFDVRSKRIVIELHTGVQIAVPSRRIEGLAEADPDELNDIEISATGLALHWPKLDADVYVPGLMHGIFGSRNWMAAQLGAIGGRAKSASKVAASRANGRKGGRPAKIAAGG